MLQGLSLAAESEATLGCGVQASRGGGLSHCGARTSGCLGFSSCGVGAQYLQLPGAKAQVQMRWTGFVAPRRMGSSWIRDQTCVSCIGRQILHH